MINVLKLSDGALMAITPIIVGIAGGSCSGKTTFLRRLHEYFGKDKSTIIWQDNYYIDQSSKFDKDGGAVNFDHPSAIDFEFLADQLAILKNGDSIKCPTYDFATHTRTSETIPIEPRPIILVDGILIFHLERLRNLFDHRIYISAHEDVRFERRLKRDTTERGRTEQGVHDQFYKQVAPMHDEFVTPTKQFAHRVINQDELEAAFRESIDFLESKIS